MLEEILCMFVQRIQGWDGICQHFEIHIPTNHLVTALSMRTPPMLEEESHTCWSRANLKAESQTWHRKTSCILNDGDTTKDDDDTWKFIFVANAHHGPLYSVAACHWSFLCTMILIHSFILIDSSSSISYLPYICTLSLAELWHAYGFLLCRAVDFFS